MRPLFIKKWLTKIKTNMNKNAALLIFLGGILLSSQSQSDSIDSDSMLESLQADMQKFSTIATETKQNVDYMPYVISTLTSHELQQLGILTLREALNLVPGVDISVGMAGVKTPIFRGSNPFAVGQSKLIIDGVVVNDRLFGGYSQYLDMPTEIIHRIEVVRGPGSLLKHVSGYAGSIHVITKANRDDALEQENSVFVSAGSNEYSKGGFVVSHQADNYRLSSDFFYQSHDAQLPVGADRFGNSGDSQQGIKNYGIGLNAEFGKLNIKGRLNSNDSGVSYGQAFSLSDDLSDFLKITNRSIDLTYQDQLNDGIKVELAVGYFDEWRELQNKVMPDGSMLMMPMPPRRLSDGRYFLVDFRERSLYQRLEFEFNRLSGHKITAGLNFSQSKITRNDAGVSDDGLLTRNSFNLLTNSERNLISFYAEDLFDLSEALTIQLGLKFDRYDDVDDQFSPRGALVYRFDDNNIYKLMFTRSYREPSWREQYLARPAFFQATAGLEEETVDAYEAAYIRKFGINRDFKINAFFLRNLDQIHAQNVNNKFLNSGDNELYGLEIEFRSPVYSNGQVNLNYSYVEGSNVYDAQANSAQHIATAYYSHRISSNLTLSAVANFVGEKQRISGDNRASISNYTTLDLAATYTHKASNTTLSASVKNLTDKLYVLPSPANTYVDDFQQQGRSLVFAVQTDF